MCRWMSAEVSKLEKDLKANGVALIGIGPEETGVKEFKDGGFFKGGENLLQSLVYILVLFLIFLFYINVAQIYRCI